MFSFFGVTTMSRNLRLAIEDAELGAVEGEGVGTDAALAEATSDASVAVADATVDAAPVETFDTAIEETSGDIGALETSVETISESLDPEGDEGGEGMSPTAAEFATEQLLKIRGKHMLGASRVSVPAKESFKQKPNRKELTRLTLEGFVDTIKKLWGRLKEFVKSLWQRIVSAVKSVFQSNIRTEKRANELLKQVNAMTSSTIKEKDVKNSSILKGFSVKGKCDFSNVKDILTRHLALAGLQTTGATAARAALSDLSAVFDGLTALSNNAGKGGAGASSWAGSLSTATQAYSRVMLSKFGQLAGSNAISPSDVQDLFKDIKDVNKTGSSYEYAGPFFGSKYAVVASLNITPPSGAPAGTTITEYHFQFTEIEAKAASSTPTLTKPEMTATCNQVIGLCQKQGEVERANKVGESVVADVEKQIDQAIKTASSVNSADSANSSASEINKALTHTRTFITSLIKTFSATNGSLNVSTMSASNTALDYVAASLKNYGDK